MTVPGLIVPAHALRRWLRHRRWVVLAVVPTLLLAGDFFYWRLAVAQLRHAFDRGVGQARADGWDIRYDGVETGGWPDAAVLRVGNVSVTMRGRTFGPVESFHWGSDAVLIRSRLIHPDVMTAVPVGPRPMHLNGGPPIAISAEFMRLSVSWDREARPSTMHWEAVGFTGSMAGHADLAVGRFDLHADIHGGASRDQPAVTFSLVARPVSLPEDMGWSLGPHIRDVVCEGVFNGPLPTEQGLARRATAWRDEGGSLELRKLMIDWGPAKLEGTATLALDEELQPMGAGTARIAGYSAALDALAANAVLTRSSAKAAKAVLSLLANAAADGQPEEVEAPLTLQFRTLSVRQVPLARLPEIEWPAH